MVRVPFAAATLAAAVAVLSTPLALAQGAEGEPRLSTSLLPTIVVTADPLGDRTADDLIQPVSVLFGDELDRRRAATLGALLDGLPGVANSAFGPGVGRPVIRGLQGARVRTLEDGMPTADVSGEGADHAIAIDPARAEQIEVYRGPAVLLYGSGAAGGVVNVRTDRFNPDFGDRARLHGQLSYGENGNDRQGRAAVELPASDQLVFRADASVRRTGDFDIDGFQQIGQTEGRKNRLVNSSIDNDAFSVTGLLRGDWGHLGLGLSTWKTEYGIPENFDARPRDEGGQSDDFERVFAEYDRLDLRGEFVNPLPGFTSARLKASYTWFEQEEVEFEFRRTSLGGELDERIVEADFENEEFELRTELVHAPIAGWRGVLGLQYTDRDFQADDPRGAERGFYVRPTRTRTAALFLLEERPTDFGALEFSARVERERANPDAVVGSRVVGVTGMDGQFIDLPEQLGSQTFWPASVSGGAIYEIDDAHHLRASITRAQRAPSAEQLYAFGRHSAAGTFEVGNPDLSKETYLNLELGLDRHAGPFRFDAAVFYNRVNDFTYLQSEGDGMGNPVAVNDIGNRAGEGQAIGCGPDDGGLCRLRNQLVFNQQANAEFYGAELGAVVDLMTGPTDVALRLNADHVRGKLRSGGNLPRMTPTRAGLGFDVAFSEVTLSADYRRVFKQNRTAEVEDSTNGYNLVSFDVAWEPRALPGTELFVQGRNLLNEDGRLHQSFFRDEAPIIGRAFVAGIRFDLQ